MTYADSHTHLYLEAFEKDIDEVIERASDAGVGNFFLPNIDTGSIPQLKALCERFPAQCHPMMGLHPTSVGRDYHEQLGVVMKELEQGTFVAVGETGIDLYWDKTYFREQEDAFRLQIRKAMEQDLPIVIHSRESFDEIFRIMDEEYREGLKGIFHCFTGSSEQAKKIIGDYGFLLGIGGVLTFKNGGLGPVVKDIPLEHIVLETDAPYLAPVPFRGKRNESSYIPIIATHLAQWLGMETEKVASATTKNALEIFGLNKS